MVDPADMRKYLSSVPRPYIQTTFPYLTPSEREVILTGYCDSCWDELFGEAEEPAADGCDVCGAMPYNTETGRCQTCETSNLDGREVW
jgi:hypothetical protein